MHKRIGLLPYLFFIASGACALVYEVTWGKYLGLFFGNTTLAHMCVLSSFMGGLALGSVLLGRLSARLANPLRFYGWLELAIGTYAVAYPFFIRPLQSFVMGVASGAPFGSPVWILVKLGVSMLVLLLPTILMGGTFPVLTRHFQPESPGGEDKTEWLYLTNCAGAVAGSLAAGFVVIPTLGLKGTLVTIGTANALLGALAVGLGMVLVGGGRRGEPVSPAVKESARNPLVRPVYIAIGISGAAAMVYELVWIRMFAITLGASTYSFTLMLAAFITGIALGSLAVGVIPWTRRRPLLAFALAEIAIGFAVVVSIPLYERLPYLFWKWSSLLNPSMESFWLHSLVNYLLCFIFMVVPTIFSGMTLPLAIKSIAHQDERVGRDAGFIYGANTAGTLIGALFTGLVLIPRIGLRSSLEVALMANMAAGVILLLRAQDFPRRRALALGLCMVGALLLRVSPDWHPGSFTFGTFRKLKTPPPNWETFRQTLANARVLFFGEDGSNTVAVMAAVTNMGAAPQVTLYTDGKAEASSVGDMPTQVLLAQLPMLLRPGARDALVVGLGSGVSAGSALTHPDVQVDCVEISPVVASASRLFDGVNGSVLTNPRMNLIIEDARTLLAATPKKYDVIISEPTNPWVAGMGNLFSREFFQSVDRVLKPQGLVVQWFQTYEISDELVKVLLRTMRSVFPNVYVFQSTVSDYIVVSSRKPLNPDFRATAKAMEIPAVREDLDRISIDSPAALFALQVLSPEGAARLCGRGIVNSDDYPLLEYEAPKAQYVGNGASLLAEADERFRSGKDLFSVRYLGNRPLDQRTCKSLIRTCSDLRMSQTKLLYSLLDYYVTHWPDDYKALRGYAKVVSRNDASRALAAAEIAARLHPDPKSLEILSDVLLSNRFKVKTVFTPQDLAPVRKLLEDALKQDPHNDVLRTKLHMIKEADQWGTKAYPHLPDFEPPALE